MCRHVITRPILFAISGTYIQKGLPLRESPPGQDHTLTGILGTPQTYMTLPKLDWALCRKRDGRPVQRSEFLPAGKGYLSISSSARYQSSRVRSWSSLSRTGKATMGNATRWPLTQETKPRTTRRRDRHGGVPHDSRISPFMLCRVPQFLGSSCSPATVPLQLASVGIVFLPLQHCHLPMVSLFFPPYQMADLHVISL